MSGDAHVSSDDDNLKRKERYADFVKAQLAQRPIRGRWGELVRVVLTSVIHGRGVKRGFRGWWDYRRDERGWKTFLDRAEPVMGYTLMVNSILREPGIKQSAGLVLITFESISPTEVADIVLKVLKEDAPQERDRTLLRELMMDEKYQVHRRRKLPESVSGGRTIYACDIWIADAAEEPIADHFDTAMHGRARRSRADQCSAVVDRGRGR